MTRTQLRRTLARLMDDVRRGRWQLPRYALSDVYRKAEELSGKHAASTGCRSLDILHVAGAVVLGARDFLTFDARQGKLARKLDCGCFRRPRSHGRLRTADRTYPEAFSGHRGHDA